MGTAESRRWYALALADDFKTGTVTPISVSTPNGTRRLIVCRQGEALFAAENACPHLGRPLDGARLMGYELSCPFHGATFDLKQAGRVRCGPAVRPLTLHPVRLQGNELQVELPAEAPSSLAWLPKRD